MQSTKSKSTWIISNCLHKTQFFLSILLWMQLKRHEEFANNNRNTTQWRNKKSQHLPPLGGCSSLSTCVKDSTFGCARCLATERGTGRRLARLLSIFREVVRTGPSRISACVLIPAAARRISCGVNRRTTSRGCFSERFRARACAPSRTETQRFRYNRSMGGKY